MRFRNRPTRLGLLFLGSIGMLRCLSLSRRPKNLRSLRSARSLAARFVRFCLVFCAVLLPLLSAKSAFAAMSMIAPQCDHRGAVTFAKAPHLQPPESSIDFGLPCVEEDDADANPWLRGAPKRSERSELLGVESLAAPVNLVAPLVNLSLDFTQVPVDNRYASALHGMAAVQSLERPPRS
jgi:hypothetical protein